MRNILPLALVALAILGLGLVHATAQGPRFAATAQGSLTMVKLVTNATSIGVCAVSIALLNGTIVQATGTLFGNIRIVVNATWSQATSVYTVLLQNFHLLVTQRNIIVANSTNVNQNQLPTNQVFSVSLFPDVAVVFILSFAPVCVTSGSLAKLEYIDGLFNFVFSLP